MGDSLSYLDNLLVLDIIWSVSYILNLGRFAHSCDVGGVIVSSMTKIVHNSCA